MRIVQIVENLEIGGLERLVVDFVREQVNRGHEPYVYCVGQPGALAGQAEAAGAALTAFRKLPGPCPKTVWKMSQGLRKLRPHVVHTHSWVIHHYGVVAGRLAGVPLVVNTRHNIMRSSRQERWFRPSLPFTDAVIMVSGDAHDSFVNNGGVPARKAHVIRNGIPVDKFSSVPARPGSLRPVIRFGTVGRLALQKDHKTMLEAFATLSDLPHAELHILGDGPLRDAIEQDVRRLGLKQRVWLHGASLDVPAFLSNLDIFVLSSVYEGLPLAVLEAMAAGLPVVSTKVGGVPEVCPEGDVGFFAPASNPQALGAAMREAANTSQLATMGEHARRIVTESYSLSRTWLQHEELFRTLWLRRGYSLAALEQPA